MNGLTKMFNRLRKIKNNRTIHKGHGTMKIKQEKAQSLPNL